MEALVAGVERKKRSADHVVPAPAGTATFASVAPAGTVAASETDGQSALPRPQSFVAVAT